MNVNLLIGSALLIFSSLTWAQAAAPTEAPTVDSILAKHVEASGGKAAMEKITSRVIKFKMESEAVNGDGEIFATEPNKQRMHMDAEGAGALDEGFDGNVAWAKSPWTGLRVKTGDELAKVVRDADFHRDLKFKLIYPGLTYKGTEKVGEDEAYLLESKPSTTSKERFWFGSKSNLLVHQESEFEGPQGVIKVSVFPQDYKTFDGLKYPGQLKLKVKTGEQEFDMTMKFTDVKHNVKIDAAKFAKPSE